MIMSYYVVDDVLTNEIEALEQRWMKNVNRKEDYVKK